MKMGWLQEIEDLVTEGKIQQARAQLKKLQLNKIPRNRRAFLAGLCRRVGLAELALKILRPVVRSQNREVQPSDEEILQYAQSLSSVGGSEEAIRLLSRRSLQESEPRALLYLAFANFAQWRYDQALPHLEEFLKRTPPTSYVHRIGEVNRVAALLSVCDYDRAYSYLLPLIETLDREGHRILAGNCRELLAQVLFHKGQSERAIEALDQALHLLGDQKYPDSLFVKKWQLIIGLTKSPKNQSLRHSFHELREKAAEISHWETLRDIDFNQSRLFSLPELFQFVYFGTPYDSYRNYMTRGLDLPQVPKEFLRQMEPGSLEGPIFDLEQLCSGTQAPLQQNSLFHRLFHEVSVDFYKPKRVATLFEKVYPGEHFDIEHSTQKIKMLISRLRKVIAPYGLTVKELSGKGYTLSHTGPVTLVYRLNHQPPTASRAEGHLQQFIDLFGCEIFTSQDVAKRFEVTQRTALRWLREHVENGKVEKHGEKKGAKYRIVSVSERRLKVA